MVYQSGTDTQKQTPMRQAIKTMPRWKWRVLGVGLLVGCIGVGAQAYSYFKATPTQPPHTVQLVPSAPGVGAPAGSSGFVGSQPVGSSTDDQVASPGQPQSDSSLLWKALLSKVGFSLFVGVIVGVIFRTFLRTAVLISALLVGAAMGLSYFHIMNVDLTMVKNETAQATGWLGDQGYRLKDMLFHTLPSSTSAGVGFFLGLKRR